VSAQRSVGEQRGTGGSGLGKLLRGAGRGILLPVSFEERITLPHTDLRVSRIGLGSSFGVEPADIETAFDGGINYFYWGSIRRNGFGRGVRTLARRARDEMVIALQSYARWPRSMMRKRFESGLLRLDIDCADILILGWHNWRPPQPIIDEALELRERGLVRYLMMSGHNRPFFSEIAKESLLDLFMVRYNAVHRGAERDVFPLLPGGDERPGTCAYTATNRALLLNPRKTPPGERTPGASDCYRFCLSHPEVNMVLSGPANTEQVREALAALEAGPLDESELAWMRRVGDHIRGRPGESAERSAAA
jgi:aryl-alcohol dehydrogenase-like predicted oxidoreductase